MSSFYSNLFNPTPSDVTPPQAKDGGSPGQNGTAYARADHVHPSTVRRARLQTASDGSLLWTYTDSAGNPYPFPDGIKPQVQAIAETGTGVTDVFNAQVEGEATNINCKIRVTRTQKSVASVLGLTVLSVPASVGQVWVHLQATDS